MATQIILIPQQITASGISLEYTGSGQPLDGKSFVCAPYGIEGIALAALDAGNTSLLAQSDIFAFPTDLTTVLTNTDVANFAAFAFQWNIPHFYVAAGMTWAQVARTTMAAFQAAQRHVGLTGGNGIFTKQTVSSLQTAVANVKAGTAQAGLVSALAATVGVSGVSGVSGLTSPQPTLNSSLSTQPTLSSNLESVASSFGFNPPDMSSDVENTILSIAQQWTAPLFLNRGDGFAL